MLGGLRLSQLVLMLADKLRRVSCRGPFGYRPYFRSLYYCFLDNRVAANVIPGSLKHLRAQFFSIYFWFAYLEKFDFALSCGLAQVLQKRKCIHHLQRFSILCSIFVATILFHFEEDRQHSIIFSLLK